MYDHFLSVTTDVWAVRREFGCC